MFETVDWPPAEFVEWFLASQSAPYDSRTGKPLFPGVEGGVTFGAQRDILLSAAQVKALAGGEQAGKSHISGGALVMDMLYQVKLALERGVWDEVDGLKYLVAAATYRLTSKEVEQAANTLRRMGFRDGRDMEVHVSESDNASRLVFLGMPKSPPLTVRIDTLPTGNVERLAMNAYRGVVLAEGAQSSERAYEKLLGRVTPKQGWLLLSGTFEQEAASPWYRDLLSRSFDAKAALEEWEGGGRLGPRPPEPEVDVYAHPSWENKFWYPLGWDDPKIVQKRNTLPPEEFWERFGGRPARSRHVVMRYADSRYQVRERGVGVNGYVKGEPVHLWIDPGYGHATAVVAVQYGGESDEECWVIDIVYRKRRHLWTVVEECVEKPWAGDVERVVMDYHGGRQATSTGTPPKLEWRTRWLELTGESIPVTDNKVGRMDGTGLHDRALLNTWPVEVAKEQWGEETEPDEHGIKLYFVPGVAGPLFGGESVDGRPYSGEYNNHKFAVDGSGNPIRDEPRKTHDDVITAINYGLFDRFGAKGTRRLRRAGESVAWSPRIRMRIGGARPRSRVLPHLR